MNCQQAQTKFGDRLDGEKNTALDAHLASCAQCRNEWATYEKAWLVLGRHEAIEPSFGFAERTLRRLQEAPARRPWFALPAWRWAVLGTLAVGLTVGINLRQRATQQQRAEFYATTQQADYLEDYDVIASLHLLEGENQL